MRQQTGGRNAAIRAAMQHSITGNGSYSGEGQGGYRICCADDDGDIVASIVGAINLARGDPAVESFRSSVGSRVLSVAKRPGQHELTAVCRNPVLGIVEFDGACEETRDADLFRDASPRSFMADFSTETAYDLDLAQVIVWRLEMATGLSGDRRPAVQNCLHEGIANTLLHGNLEIGSLSNAFDLDNIVEFLKEVEDRLSSDELAIRRIRVLAEWSDQKIAICITDEGRGFDHSSVMRFRRDSRPALAV